MRREKSTVLRYFKLLLFFQILHLFLVLSVQEVFQCSEIMLISLRDFTNWWVMKLSNSFLFRTVFCFFKMMNH